MPRRKALPPQWTITIPNWHPAKLNALRGHWTIAYRLKKVDREIVAWACRGVPAAKGKRRLTLTIVLEKGQRGGDPDAYHKSCNDALVACDMLTDDNRQGVELMPILFTRKTRMYTIITLEDIT
jgi:hypothetical protein